MHPFRLTIAEPCHEDWNSMTGSEQRRHCSSCTKDVVALAEMLPEDALALVRTAKPHSLCLRIEHDDDGAVIFRKNAAPTHTHTNVMPLLMLTLTIGGASLLLTACDKPTPTAPAQNFAQTASTQHVDHVDHAATDSTPVANATNATNATNTPVVPTPGAQTASSAAVNPITAPGDRLAKPQHRPTRATMGCVCAVGDTLCDCL